MGYDDKPAPAKRQICNLLSVIGGGVVCALLISSFLLYYYGPTGSYLAQNTILSPAVSEILRYQDIESNGKGTKHFVFDSIQFSYYDTKSNQWHKETMNEKKYRSFYELIKNDKSLQDIPETVKHLFNHAAMASLNIYVRPDNGLQEVKVFQTINFSIDGNYYRVQLREANSKDQWAYFYHPGIYQQTLEII